MDATPITPSGIPVVVAGIPTVQTPDGIISPFPYMNAESEEWKGADEDGGFDSNEGNSPVILPHDDSDGGGDEIDPDEEDDEDIDDGDDTGFGIGLMLSTFFRPPAPLLPA